MRLPALALEHCWGDGAEAKGVAPLSAALGSRDPAKRGVRYLGLFVVLFHAQPHVKAGMVIHFFNLLRIFLKNGVNNSTGLVPLFR